MKIIMDTSAVVAVVTNEPEKPAILKRVHRASLILPESVPWEIGNAFSTMLKRQRITSQQAITAWRVFRSLSFATGVLDIESAIKIAGEHNIYAYDAYIIACAIEYQCPILTLDSGLTRVAGEAGVKVLELEMDNRDADVSWEATAIICFAG